MGSELKPVDINKNGDIVTLGDSKQRCYWFIVMDLPIAYGQTNPSLRPLLGECMSDSHYSAVLIDA